MQHGVINKQREPFSVRDKGFWEVERARKLLEPKFAQSLCHEPDGLIFQPSLDVSALTQSQYSITLCTINLIIAAIRCGPMR